MKTATVRIYKMWGTNSYSADVLYRGKLIICFDGRDEYALRNIARTAARNRKLTHIKFI
jgi:hypothetical protein